MVSSVEAPIDSLDEGTKALYLSVPGEHVVLLQALVESYEGLAVVRTLDIRKSLVCLLTTPTMLADTLDLVRALQPALGLRFIDRPEEAEQELYLGYFKKNREKKPC